MHPLLARLQRILRFLAPEAPAPTNDAPADLQRVREVLLLRIVRVGALLGTLAALFSTFSLAGSTTEPVLIAQWLVLALVWVLALNRRVTYPVRGGLLCIGLYILGLNELLSFGYGIDVQVFLLGFVFLTLLLFDGPISVYALLIVALTLATIGALLVTEVIRPLSSTQLHLPSWWTVATTTLNVVLVIGTIQIGMQAMLQHWAATWQREREVRRLLEHERATLEQRVDERTRALAEAHDTVVAASRLVAAQNTYLAALHQTTLALLDRRDLQDLLQAIVDQAAQILNAPYVELMLHEGDELVVRAFTANQPYLCGDRVGRGTAALSWQAFDTQAPATLDDYLAWERHRTIYASSELRAVVDLPIVVRQQSRGVLGLGRGRAGQPFTPEEVAYGMRFAHLAALVLDNTQLYTIAIQQAEELQARNTDLDAFAHTVAHELKSPLTILNGNTQLLQRAATQLDAGQIEKLIQSSLRTGQKMNQVIDDLLLLASVRTNDAVPITTLAMGEIVAGLAERMAGMALGQQAQIRQPAGWPTARGYAPWVEHVWLNYVSNAIKYGGRPPLIELGADPAAGGMVRFWVRDNGPGLSPEQQAYLFAAFTRLHPERASGYGVGLTVVKQIISQLGGEVGVESAPGAGSTFFFTLPAG